MCANCTKAYWKYKDEYNKSMRDGVQGFSPTEKSAKRAYDRAVRECEKTDQHQLHSETEK